MRKLFVIYVGGAHENSLIELHDIRLIIAKHIEETFESLKKNWWGTPQSLHIDAFGALSWADGYEIHLRDTPPCEDSPKLYFVNLGGYDPKQFTELHKNVFIIAENESKAKAKALKQILDWKSHHRDYQFDVDHLIRVDSLIGDRQTFIHLIPNEHEIPFEFTCGYIKIG